MTNSIQTFPFWGVVLFFFLMKFFGGCLGGYVSVIYHQKGCQKKKGKLSHDCQKKKATSLGSIQTNSHV